MTTSKCIEHTKTIRKVMAGFDYIFRKSRLHKKVSLGLLKAYILILACFFVSDHVEVDKSGQFEREVLLQPEQQVSVVARCCCQMGAVRRFQRSVKSHVLEVNTT